MTTIEQYYKESIAEKYINDFKEELNIFEKFMISPMSKKMKKILNSDKPINVNSLSDLEDLGFWRRILGMKMGNKQVFEKLIDKTFNFLKEKQEKIIEAETNGRLFDLLQEVIGIEQSNTLTQQDLSQIDISALGEFSGGGDFTLNSGIEKTENNKTYIEISGKKYYQYEDGMNGLGYQAGGSSDKWFYVGEFKNGKSEGLGVYIDSNGNKYEGARKEDHSEGQGTWIDANGNVYEGARKEDKKDGQGKFTWTNGNIYEGTREADEFTGGKFIDNSDANDPKTYDVQKDGNSLTITGPDDDPNLGKTVENGEIKS